MSFATPMRLWPDSLRAQLTIWYLLTMGAALCALAAFVYVSRAGVVGEQLDADLQAQARVLAAVVTPAVLGLDVSAALAALPETAEAPVIVRDASGSELFRSRAFPPLDWREGARLAEAARDGPERVTLRAADGVPARVVTLRIPRPGTSPIVMQVARSTAAARASLRRTALGLALVVVLVLAGASYGGGFIARRALAPVDQIVGSVREIQASQLHTRVAAKTRAAELDRLVTTLNAMLDRLEGSMRSARRFAADASHELQTPLATMRALVESRVRVTATPVGEAPVEDDLGRDLLAEIERLSRLVSDLRLIALAESGQLLNGAERLNLADLAAECCDIARAFGEAREVNVTTELAEQAHVLGSALHLRRAVLNIANNAVRYSPPRASVHVTLGRAGARAVLSVSDTGCGIEADDLPHVFEAFYRADRARARDTGGSGLGLTIAREIVVAHGGDIRVQSVPGVGSTFAILLPLVS